MEASKVAFQWPFHRAKAIWDNIIAEKLWKRMLKIVIATTIVNSIVLIPATEAGIGKAAYLGGITTAFDHPGRRFGQMAEALILTIAGTTLGMVWSLLGLYLGSLLIHSNPHAAYTIRAIFLAIAFLLHGFFRSHTPRLFLGTVLFIIISVVTLSSPAKTVTSAAASQIFYPILIAVGVLFLVNICIFPEFSSGFLGNTVVETLEELKKSLRQAGDYLVQDVPLKMTGSNTPGTAFEPKNPIMIKDITASKSKIRAKVSGCIAAQSECNFELAFSILPPRDLKTISDAKMNKLMMNIVAIIGACESKFALAGEETEASKSAEPTGPGTSDSQYLSSKRNASVASEVSEKHKPRWADANDLDLVKPRREIEFGDPKLLSHFLVQMTSPFTFLQSKVERSIDVTIASVAFAYHVSTLPSGSPAPKGVNIEELDVYIDTLKEAIQKFDTDVHDSLEATEGWHQIRAEWPDIMPREEIFLISSFYLNMRQAAIHVCEMLETSRSLVDKCEKRNSRRRFYAPRISWQKWLRTGGEDFSIGGSSSLRAANDEADYQDIEKETGELLQTSSEATQNPERQDPEWGESQRPNADPPAPHRNENQEHEPVMEEQMTSSVIARTREHAADLIEWIQHSDDVQYAFKLCIAGMLVTWPAFVASWNEWYSLNRGLWAALQLVLITEPTVGSSVNTFILRFFGTVYGCLWGWAAYEARSGNRIVCAAMICIGVVPAAYVIVGSRFVKAGIVVVVSITVVALATELETVPDTATENFLKRFIAFTIGALVALVVQVVFVPVKARTKLVHALASSLRQIAEMENCIAFGVEAPESYDILSPPTIKRFDKASSKAKATIKASEDLLPFCSKEPRLKGSFEPLLPIYKEILFVLHQIVDRMDNMIALRTAYGSGPLQEYNDQIFPYRRTLAASIIVTLFAVQQALSTRLPLPQFLPSSRLAQLRMINRVREAVRDDVRQRSDAFYTVRKQAVRQNFLSWNAGSMAQAEIIEYLEELCDLTKLLVGANEFRSGLLTRPTYRQYLQKIGHHEPALAKSPSLANEEIEKEPHKIGLTRRRAATIRRTESTEIDQLPYSLQRIQSKRQDAKIARQRTLGEGGEKRP